MFQVVYKLPLGTHDSGLVAHVSSVLEPARVFQPVRGPGPVRPALAALRLWPPEPVSRPAARAPPSAYSRRVSFPCA
eukprot:150906-Prymnesium_polylepis.1